MKDFLKMFEFTDKSVQSDEEADEILTRFAGK